MKRSTKDRKIIAQLINDPKEYRKTLGEVQSVFWGRFGIGQSVGSRYEAGREIPETVAMLAAMYALGYVSEDDLQEIRDVLSPFYSTPQDAPKPLRPQLRPGAMERAEKRREYQSRSGRARISG